MLIYETPRRSDRDRADPSPAGLRLVASRFRGLACAVTALVLAGGASLRADPVPSIAAGGFHSAFVKTDGTLWTAGYNGYGQLGDGSFSDRHSPVQVDSAVVQVSAGATHTAYVKADGTLWTTGRNLSGQLGDGSTTDRASPVQVATDVTAVAAGGFHTVFLKTDGSVWAMGRNLYGELGDGTTTNRSVPAQVATGVTAIAAGTSHTLILKADGSLWAAGDNTFGQLGDGSGTGQKSFVHVADGVATLAAGGGHSLLVKTDGSLWAVGRNGNGQLGDGTTTSRATPVPVLVGGNPVTDVAAVAAGASFSVFRKTDGTLWSMGNNNAGQLGDGTTTTRTFPVQVATAVMLVAAGDSSFHQLYVANGGVLWAVGDDSRGQLGDGATTNRSTAFQGPDIALMPPAITTPPAGLTTTAFSSVTFSVTADGTAPLAYQWYRNGVAIDGATAATYTLNPVHVPDGGDFTVTVTNVAGSATSGRATLVVNTATPVLTWPTPAAITYGAAVSATQLNATANTDGTFTYTPEAGTVPDAGSVKLTVDFAPTDIINYKSTGAVNFLTVNKAPATVTLGNLSPAYDGTAKAVTVTTVPAGLSYAVTYDGQAQAPSRPGSYTVVATVHEANYAGSATGTLTIGKAATTFTLSATSYVYTGLPQGPTVVADPAGATFTTGGSLVATSAGTYLASATATGDYTGANAALAWTIARAAQTISFTAIPAQKFPAGPITLSAKASSGLPVTFSVVAGAATISGNTLTLLGTGPVTVRASQAGGANYEPAPDVDRSFVSAMPPRVDFNSDGWNDLVWENTVTGERGVWLMTGTSFASWLSFGTLAPEWRLAGAVDVDGDGQTDLVWENTATGERGVWFMNHGVFTRWLSFGIVPTDWHIGAVADLDGDGHPDLIWENQVTGERGVWILHGGAFSAWYSYGVMPTEWKVGAVADINGDGRADIVWQNLNTGERGVWLMNGLNFSAWYSYGVVPTELVIVGADDLNGDGWNDLLWEDRVTGERGAWLLNGITFSAWYSFGTLPTDWHLAD